MGLLKKARRKETNVINGLSEKVKQVTDAEALGILTLDPNEPQARIYRELWEGKNDEYRRNFSQNLFRVWCISHLKRVNELGGAGQITFSVYDKESSVLLGTYSDKRGFRGQ